ncbi:MAG: M23 family metallopeptidase [Eubacteriales bacterium]|nr:M23 family metallopeptidase [Eubacteriales bacterium]
MNEKNNKKSNSVLNQKNLTVIGITAIAVVLFAMIMTYIMPKSTENDKSFDSKAWKEAVSEADKNDVYQSSDDSDDYNRAAKQTTAEALPTQSEQAKAEPKSSDNATSDMTSESESTKTEDVKDNEQSQTRQSGDKIIMQQPVSGAVLNDYSGDNLVYSKTMQDWRTHNGIDFAANEGDDVLAAADGTVEAITDNGMFGKTIIILHDGGIRSIYSNLAEDVAVAVGDNVLSGSVIGKVGNSAAAEVTENSHLHFEVSVNEESVNPHDYLAVPQTDSSDVQE